MHPHVHLFMKSSWRPSEMNTFSGSPWSKLKILSEACPTCFYYHKFSIILVFFSKKIPRTVLVAVPGPPDHSGGSASSPPSSSGPSSECQTGRCLRFLGPPPTGGLLPPSLPPASLRGRPSPGETAVQTRPPARGLLHRATPVPPTVLVAVPVPP